MKKMLLALTTAAMMMNAAAGAEAADRLLPDTDKITAGAHLEYVGVGESAKSVWVVDNPTIHNRQQVATGEYVSHVDINNDMVVVLKDGVPVTEFKIYNISNEFNYD